MTESAACSDLQGALDLSRELLAAADRGDMPALARLDGERLRLLKSRRAAAPNMDAGELELLREIARLNDGALGLLEHHRRIKGRALDMAAVGRRAVAAYATNRQQR